jgi:hypothetical protein
MSPSKENAPLARGVLGETEIVMCSTDNKRTRRRQVQILHLHQCGPRCLLEAMLAIEAGEPLDAALADFERLPPSVYDAAIMAFCDGGVH